MGQYLQRADLLDVLLIVEGLLDGDWFEVVIVGVGSADDAVAVPDRAEFACSERLLSVEDVVAVPFVLGCHYL